MTTPFPFPVTASVPAPGALLSRVLPAYDLGSPASACTLHMSGVNDVYLVRSRDGRRFVLKVYRHGWRSEPEVRYELDLLADLDRRGVPVALPLPRKDGRGRVTPIPAPEGTRPAVLFEHAPGRPPTWPFYEHEGECRLLGRALAQIHEAALDFRSPHPRPALDDALLLDGALAALRPFVEERRPGDWRYLVGLVGRLRERLGDLDRRGLSRGVCHGDFHGGNVFLQDDDVEGGGMRVTTFDFDVCGPGWLAFDIARWRDKTHDKPAAVWDAFLDGYERERPLTADGRDAIELFETLQLFDWTRVKFTFAARGVWDSWDADFFLNDLVSRLQRAEEAAGG